MHELMAKVNASILLVTHDLAVASQVADRVVVMYAGEIVEEAEVHDLFSKTLHPYARQSNKTLESIARAIFKRWFVDFEFPNELGGPYARVAGATQMGVGLSSNVDEIDEYCVECGRPNHTIV